MSVFYEQRGVPVHSVLLLPTREEAITYPRGDIKLGFCDTCGFISNMAFDPSLHDYSSRYEATQSYSPTFSRFATHLAQDLIERHDLHGKNIIEIGCGQGEFLIELCELGGNRGMGFDPAYLEERISHPAKQQITFVPDFYSEKYTDHPADFVACKMTLEHIEQTSEFIGTVRRAVGDNPDTTVFFQVPNATRVLRDVAFWDIYYEHCSYFTPGSLAYVFRQNGFEVLNLRTDYDDQYLMIEARPGEARPSMNGHSSSMLPGEADIRQTRHDLETFTQVLPARLKRWKEMINKSWKKGERMVLWGGGSKGVSFLTTLDVLDEIPFAVDINPHKHGMFMAGTGQEIVPPELLREYQPNTIIVMNPIYCREIQAQLDRLGIFARLMPVG